MSGQHYALYGNVAIPRERCGRCNRFSFVLDGILSCCGGPTAFDSGAFVRMSDVAQRRRAPPERIKRAILDFQRNRCIYCDSEFGSIYVRRGKPGFLRINFDHVVPYSYGQNNYPYNFVAACHICNSTKRNLIFPTLDEARSFIRSRLAQEGIELQGASASAEAESEAEMLTAKSPQDLVPGIRRLTTSDGYRTVAPERPNRRGGQHASVGIISRASGCGAR